MNLPEIHLRNPRPIVFSLQEVTITRERETAAIRNTRRDPNQFVAGWRILALDDFDRLGLTQPSRLVITGR